MRTQLLGGVALLLGAVALLGGADVARAQVWAGNGGGSGFAPPAQAAPAQSWFARRAQNAQAAAWYAQYAQYLQSNGYNPYYAYYYPYYASANQGYNQQGSPYANAPAAPPGQMGPTEGALPTMPVPGDDPGPDADPDKAKDLHDAAKPAKHDYFWLDGGWDFSFVKPERFNTPLVTTGPSTSPTSSPTFHAAGLGQPGTVVLFGDNADFGMFNGVRLGAGLYLDSDDRLSLEWVGRLNIANHVRFAAASDATGNPIIGRPVFDTVRVAELAYLDSNPGLFSGGVTVDARSQFFGTEVNARARFGDATGFRADALFGFRFMRLTEQLTIRDNLQPLTAGSGLTFEGVGIPLGDVLTDVDSFRTTNHFYGVQLGGSLGWEGRWLFVNAFGKVALGATDEEVDINGSTTLFDLTAGAQSAGGGVLALPTNIGLHSRTVIGFVPEGGLNVGVKVLPSLNLTAGYSFLYWNAVVRPGGQIDRAVNSTQVPSDNTFGTLTGPQRPTFGFHDESFWIHTLTVGLDFHY